MGHCFRRTGATGTEGEQPYAQAVGAACKRLIQRDGWSVRATLADVNDYDGDAFVAIHCDGSLNPTARGASVGYRTPEGQAFGQAWKRAYAARGWAGGWRPDNYTEALSGYYGVRNAVAADTRRAFIAECGFLTSPDDRALLTAPGGPERVALAIGDALGIAQPVPEPEHQEADMLLVKAKINDRTVTALYSGGVLTGLTPSGDEIPNLIQALGHTPAWIEPGTFAELDRKSKQLIGDVAGPGENEGTDV
jgi:hypothetical protein